MSKYKVFVTRRIPQVGLDRLREIAELDIWPETLPPPYEVLQSKIPQLDGLLCLLTDRIDDSLIEASADNLAAGLRGDRLPNCVNPEIYDA
ncbi:MAG: hypothetical protein AB4352_06315 [Hormoscilla sp.]